LLTVAALAAFGACAQCLAAATATGTASVEIGQAAGVDILTPLVLPSVSTIPVVPTSQVGTPNGGSAAPQDASGLSNATLTISGQSGDAVSVAVPETFQVIRTGGTEALTVKTNTYMGNSGVVVGGDSDTMSVNVGGSLSLASADDLVPGPYEGLLVVVVQYN
jgi:hypothetical protein